MEGLVTLTLVTLTLDSCELRTSFATLRAAGTQRSSTQ